MAAVELHQRAARRSETLTSQHALGAPVQACATLSVATKVCNCINEINENNALGFLRKAVLHATKQLPQKGNWKLIHKSSGWLNRELGLSLPGVRMFRIDP